MVCIQLTTSLNCRKWMLCTTATCCKQWWKLSVINL